MVTPEPIPWLKQQLSPWRAWLFCELWRWHWECVPAAWHGGCSSCHGEGWAALTSPQPHHLETQQLTKCSQQSLGGHTHPQGTCPNPKQGAWMPQPPSGQPHLLPARFWTFWCASSMDTRCCCFHTAATSTRPSLDLLNFMVFCISIRRLRAAPVEVWNTWNWKKDLEKLEKYLRFSYKVLNIWELRFKSLLAEVALLNPLLIYGSRDSCTVSLWLDLR